jgi:hypothetical protein
VEPAGPVRERAGREPFAIGVDRHAALLQCLDGRVVLGAVLAVRVGFVQRDDLAVVDGDEVRLLRRPYPRTSDAATASEVMAFEVVVGRTPSSPNVNLLKQMLF